MARFSLFSQLRWNRATSGAVASCAPGSVSVIGPLSMGFIDRLSRRAFRRAECSDLCLQEGHGRILVGTQFRKNRRNGRHDLRRLARREQGCVMYLNPMVDLEKVNGFGKSRKQTKSHFAFVLSQILAGRTRKPWPPRGRKAQFPLAQTLARRRIFQ